MTRHPPLITGKKVGRRSRRGSAPRPSQSVRQNGVFPGRTEIERMQLAKLNRLVEQAYRCSSFYVAKLTQAGVSPVVRNLDDFAAHFPFTTKQELIKDQAEHPPYGTNLVFPIERYTRCHQTSGSTGEPLRWLDTPETWQHLLNNWGEIYAAAGVTPEDRFLFAFSFGPFIGFWSALESASQRGSFCFTAGSMNSLARLRALVAHRTTVLACTPTYALHLGEVAREQGLDLSQSALRRIIVAGEPGGSIPATRARLSELWPTARVFDHYGMTEVGPATYECPAQPGLLHVIESGYLAEVIEPRTGEPAPAGQPGELVLTTLDRIGSPVLRYRTGDLVQARAPTRCACGRHGLALEGGILGRIDDMVVVRGVNVFPSAVEETVRRCGGVGEYRVHLDLRRSIAELSVEIEPMATCQDGTALARRLEQAFQTAFSLRIPVRAVPLGSLPRFEMKSQRWVKTTE
jgi:phenylacetate-CoA ligase